MSNPANSTPAQPAQVIDASGRGHAFQVDAHDRVWHIPYPGCYKSGSVRLLVDPDHAARVDITIDGYWVAEQATVRQAQAWVAAPRSQTVMERLWAWVAL